MPSHHRYPTDRGCPAPSLQDPCVMETTIMGCSGWNAVLSWRNNCQRRHQSLSARKILSWSCSQWRSRGMVAQTTRWSWWQNHVRLSSHCARTLGPSHDHQAWQMHPNDHHPWRKLFPPRSSGDHRRPGPHARSPPESDASSMCSRLWFSGIRMDSSYALRTPTHGIASPQSRAMEIHVRSPIAANWPSHWHHSPPPPVRHED